MVIIFSLFSRCESSSNSHPSNETDWEPTIYETVDNLDGVTMNAKNGTVSSTGLIVTLENNSDQQYVYGEEFMLEKEIEENWYQVPVITADYGFNDIGYNLASSEVEELAIDWDWLYGSLDTGKYRIVKGILDVREPGDYEKYFLTAEFKID